MYGAHSNVPDLHASYERAFVKIYRDSPFLRPVGSKRAELERDRLRDRAWGAQGPQMGA